jgi:hypothetical protein
MRTALFPPLLLLSISPALAADEPKPLPEEKRAEIVAKWRKDHDAAVEKAKAQIEEGKVLLTNPDTAQVGKERVSQGTDTLAALKRNPLGMIRQSLVRNTKDGALGRLPFDVGTVVRTDATSTVVDIAYKEWFNPNGDRVTHLTPVTVRFALVPPVPKAKAKSPLKLDGIWLMDGSVVIDDKPVPVLKRVEFKKDEMPSDKTPPKKKP